MELINPKIFLIFICMGIMNAANANNVTSNSQIGNETFGQKNPSKLNAHFTSNAIAGGTYINAVRNTRPLLAYSHDGGTTWNYPVSVISAVPSDASYLAAFTGAMCSGVNCLGSGYYERLIPPNTTPASFPLLAASHDAGVTWTYPTTILTALPADIASGKFVSIPWCSGTNCIVAGDYRSKSALFIQRPLIASSSDGGSTWSYPPTIVSNLPSDFLGQGFFNTATCSGANCIAVGQYQSTTVPKFFPLISSSQDGGLTWTYTLSNGTNLPSNFFTTGVFTTASCSVSLCVAAGEYNTSTIQHTPLVVVSQDHGATWTYPTTVLTNLPEDFNTVISVNGASCNANNCVVVGQYTSAKAGSLAIPLLLSTQDNGLTWSYPISTVTTLPPDFVNSGSLNAVTCNRNICLAVGTYQSTAYNNQSVPLLASSTDGGLTWSYPPSIIANLATLPNHLLNGTFNAVSCNRLDCVAEGQYENRQPGTRSYSPLVATSHDGGVTWTYSLSAISDVPSDYFDHGVFAGGNSSFTIEKDIKNRNSMGKHIDHVSH